MEALLATDPQRPTLRRVQEDYIKEEQRNLKRELLRAQEEVKRIQSVPLTIGQFLELVDSTSGIVGSTTGASIIHLSFSFSSYSCVVYSLSRLVF